MLQRHGLDEHIFAVYRVRLAHGEVMPFFQSLGFYIRHEDRIQLGRSGKENFSVFGNNPQQLKIIMPHLTF